MGILLSVLKSLVRPRGTPPLTLEIKKNNKDAIMPQKNGTGSAGYDLHSLYGGELPPFHRAVVSTGLSMKIPQGCYGRVAPRSGLASKHGIDVMAGIIDPDYRGDLCVVLINLSPTETFRFSKGDRIAQLIVEKIASPDIVEVDKFLRFDVSGRGDKGFGSSGY